MTILRRLLISGTVMIFGISAGDMLKLNWTDRQTMPTPVAGVVAGQLGGRLIYAGGTSWRAGVKHWLRDVAVYDLSAGRWTTGPALPVGLAYGAGVAADGAIEVLGGSDGEQTYRHCFRLKTVDGAWQSTGEAPADTLLGRAAFLGGRTWLFGGCSNAADLTTCSDKVWARDKDGAWRSAASLPRVVWLCPRPRTYTPVSSFSAVAP